MGNDIVPGGVLPTDQKYYDRDYFDNGAKKVIDRCTGKEKVWGYCGTDWSGNKFIVDGILKIFNGEIGSVLDVGCGQGSFTDYALRAGLRAKGYDFSSYAVETAHNFAKGHIFQADVTQGLKEDANSYDLIFCSDMVEHIRKSKIEGVVKDFHRITRKWVFFQFPIVDKPEDIFDFEKEEGKPATEAHRLYEHFIIAGHLNMELKEWWLDMFARNGFISRDDLVVHFRSCTPREVLANWFNIIILEKKES